MGIVITSELPSGLYWHEVEQDGARIWERIEVVDGTVYRLMPVGLPIKVSALTGNLAGPLCKPKDRA